MQQQHVFRLEWLYEIPKYEIPRFPKVSCTTISTSSWRESPNILKSALQFSLLETFNIVWNQSSALFFAKFDEDFD